LTGGTHDKSFDRLSILAGFVVGALTVQGLHAQAKPPAYTIAEIDVTNPDAFAKEFAPIGGKALQDAGAKFLARGGKVVAIEGEPPKSRVAVHVWESIDKAQAGYASDATRRPGRLATNTPNSASLPSRASRHNERALSTREALGYCSREMDLLGLDE
jgi:uncharacterized protein (DUF1330 family)